MFGLFSNFCCGSSRKSLNSNTNLHKKMEKVSTYHNNNFNKNTFYKISNVSDKTKYSDVISNSFSNNCNIIDNSCSYLSNHKLYMQDINTECLSDVSSCTITDNSSFAFSNATNEENNHLTYDYYYWCLIYDSIKSNKTIGKSSKSEDIDTGFNFNFSDIQDNYYKKKNLLNNEDEINYIKNND